MTLHHQPVLLQEVIDGLAIDPNGIYIDATFGRGGHCREILKRLGAQGHLLAFDKDPQAIEAAADLASDSRFEIVHATFSEITQHVESRGWLEKVNGILMDLGVSSPQLDDPARGFSFTREGPLDMRMNPTQGTDAATWVNQASEEDIARVLFEYGEERYARRIAKAIVNEREVAPLRTTKQLADLIAKASPTQERSKHPATRTFQALRIYINRELEELTACLKECLQVLSVGGRLCVISFHSLEDRIVKRFIQREAHGDPHLHDLPIRDQEVKRRLKKCGGLIRPTSLETENNVRARSARLRIAEKLA